jgi:hypothetical protein
MCGSSEYDNALRSMIKIQPRSCQILQRSCGCPRSAYLRRPNEGRRRMVTHNGPAQPRPIRGRRLALTSNCNIFQALLITGESALPGKHSWPSLCLSRETSRRRIALGECGERERDGIVLHNDAVPCLGDTLIANAASVKASTERVPPSDAAGAELGEATR